MSVYYNKKLISGVRDVPQMTLAQYNALANKPKLWLRTDAPESDRGISASDVEYSTGVSVEDKIDELSPQTILSIPANTYQTTRQALVALYNAYMTIPDELKTKAKIIVRDQVVYTLNDLTNKAFTYVAVQSIQTVIYSLYLSQNSAGCFYLLSEIKPNTGNTIVDKTDDTQTNKIDLIV